MNTNDNTRTDVQDDVIELGVASIETQGIPVTGDEPLGMDFVSGISGG